MQAGLRLLSETGANPLILHFRYSSAIDARLRFSVPASLLPYTRKYGRFQIPSGQHTRDIRTALRVGLMLDKLGLVPKPLLIDHGASVVRMIHLAVRSGAKRIILSGVDLVGSKYFYEVDPSFLLRLGLPSFVRSDHEHSHGTMKKRPGSEPIGLVLAQLRNVLLRDRHVELLALNPSPTLRAVIPEVIL